MCGIVGQVSAQAIADTQPLEKATLSLKHRGPDAQGIWWSDCHRVGFGHRRLAIIDLSIGGAQPMISRASGCSVVFNGEIFNFKSLRERLSCMGHRFSSQSDTEVLLASYDQWGEGCLDYLDGMFSFAIYDPNNNLIFIARDRAGEKPLFYSWNAGSFYFASELKALFPFNEISRRIDPFSLECFLSFGYVPGSNCLVRGVKKLPPAHRMILRLSTMDLDVRRYWAVPASPDLESDIHPNDLLAELELELSNAVKQRLIADVPVGVLLSGGVDSSVITALASEHSEKVRTFTVSIGNERKYDESSYAAVVARHFGTEHHVLKADEDSVECMTLLSDVLDEPMIDSSIIPTFMICRLVRQHCTVVLGGDGGDELFGGYRSYDRLAWLNEKVGHIPLPLRRWASEFGALLPTGFPARSWISAAGIDLSCQLPQIAMFFNARERRGLLGGETAEVDQPSTLWRSDISMNHDIVDRATRRDFSWYLPEDILVKVDRASMSNSLEVRSPFLGRRIIEFAFSKVPSSLKAHPGRRKILLKMLGSRLLPDTLNLDRKQGFSIPLSRWSRDSRYRDLIESRIFRANAIFDPAYTRSLIKGARNSSANAERIFGLFLLEDWAERYGLSL
ncbi:asparagine synthase (glutamine-hydrolyzing) [Ancylobacter polymorphus]|uniref:asparagine synthase (glutamine-hydrolyzing) n=2 Tax=cellular organisms TaxID=131567 RepID=A0ABU0BHW1_9HYPH|nr:asparagine synthase (glutamine-hydrolyzing) [Ancylobacter polymorphus]MDQ0304642.1 asparagine synthase (glutamine-hydrolyzing) [Ancylobacter polymorphus]